MANQEKAPKEIPLLDILVTQVSERFSQLEINPDFPELFNKPNYYTLEAVVHDILSALPQPQKELMDDLLKQSKLEAKDTEVSAFLEGAEFESFDDIFLQINRAIVVAEIEKRSDPIHNENKRRERLNYDEEDDE